MTWLAEKGLSWTYQGQAAIAVSESGRQDLVQRGFIPEAVSVVHNGVEVSARGNGASHSKEEATSSELHERSRRWRPV
ncbi:MAG TPA: hypothetical protein VH879_11240 [Gemmatimonadales bacterium]